MSSILCNHRLTYVIRLDIKNTRWKYIKKLPGMSIWTTIILGKLHVTDQYRCWKNLKETYAPIHILYHSTTCVANKFKSAKLTHWGRATHIYVGKLTIISSDNGFSPGRHQAIIWTIAGILLIGPLGTNFSVILIEINTFSFKKIHLKMSSGKWRPLVSASMC